MLSKVSGGIMVFSSAIKKKIQEIIFWEGL